MAEPQTAVRWRHRQDVAVRKLDPLARIRTQPGRQSMRPTIPVRSRWSCRGAVEFGDATVGDGVEGGAQPVKVAFADE